MRVPGSEIIKYGFATGRVRVLETRMVSQARIKRLIEAENLDEVHRVLSETDYGAEMRSAETFAEVEAALESHLSKAYIVLRESNIPAQMESFFRSRYDFLNLRVLLKSGFGHQLGVSLSPLGEVPGEAAESIMKERTFDGLPAHLGLAAKEALAEYGADQRLEDIDIILDRHYFANLLVLAGELRSKWITAYTKLLIDLANGRIAVRGGDEITSERWGDYLIPGGDIADSNWRAFIAAAADKTLSFPPGRLKEHLAEIAAAASPGADYDLIADNLAIDWLVTSHRFNVGPEPVFAYAAAREHEVKLIRLIVFAHLSGLPPASIRARVSRIYA